MIQQIKGGVKMKKYTSIIFSILLLISLVGGMLPQAIPAIASFGTGGEVQVIVNAPAEVAPGSNFTASIDVDYVEGFDAADFEVSYDPTVIEITDPSIGVGITDGNIGGTAFPVS